MSPCEPVISIPERELVDGSVYEDLVKVEHRVGQGTQDWHAKAVAALRSVYDPEIPLNVYDLGLIYKVETCENGTLKIVMTLTSPSCPEAESIPRRVEFELKTLADTKQVELDLTWDPPWGPERMSEEASLELGFY